MSILGMHCSLFRWPKFEANPVWIVLEALAEERRCSIGDTDDFVSCLPIEFEIELSPRPAVIPVGEMLELAASHWPLRGLRSFDSDAHARRLACDAALLSDRFGVSDNAARDEALAALSLPREHENRVTFGDQLAAIHRLVRDECERDRKSTRLNSSHLKLSRMPSSA